MISLIAILHYRRVILARPHEAILEMLDTHRASSWLSVAIGVYRKLSKKPFVIIEDESILHPVIKKANGI